jgi:hypothetical protein
MMNEELPLIHRSSFRLHHLNVWNIAAPGGVYLGDCKLPGLFHLLLSPASA